MSIPFYRMMFKSNSLFIIAIISLFSCSKTKEINSPITSIQKDSISQLLFYNKFPSKTELIDSTVSIVRPGLDISKYGKEDIKKLLQKLYMNDQKYRDSVMAGKNWHHAKKYFWKYMKFNDSINQILLSKLIDKIGFPTEDEYGEQEALGAYLIIWHASTDYKKKYILLIETAAMQRKVPMWYFVTLKDRVLIAEGKEQLYGTAKFYDTSSNKQVLFPVFDERNLNKRRALLGLEPI